MKQTLLSLTALITASGAASAVVTFHTDFDEASLAAITGLNIDTPSTTGDSSGTVTLNTTSDQLDLTANSADMWTTRDGAPVAWVASPTVAVGESWYVETEVTMANDTGTNRATYDQAGLLFYSAATATNTGGQYAHMLSDWNGWAAQSAVLGTGAASVSQNLGLETTNLYLRTEITANATDNTYLFLYKENAGDAWSTLTTRTSAIDNSQVGLVLKSNNSNATGAAQFNSFTVGTIDTIPEPSTSLLAGLAGLSLAFRRRK
ncbi:PEP-CTERM sorting domain-containing protein [Akkermansiaceae bacterium]|nr:PEP-CTERM sorting domain-containing protein [Akkermansiaceae bacterium]MDB4636921.1 PEP-CTERM sorting domain-containing protein [bacterium]MDB4310733.1 PEP-CTERM sorting domain-containing protein [Akkermansiaceae bacterium]MDB4316793.1 PEP-CTERM sorting domain-containing protein [Akkermansiaceae bacterium]MDB4325973.1 PEP-CTERM sorting domain-containing protein [Akkermansiaceae bacterium]